MPDSPIYSLNKFKGMGYAKSFYTEGLVPHLVDGSTVLRQNNQIDFKLNQSSHANWANLPIILAMTSKYENNDFVYGIGNKYITRNAALSLASSTTPFFGGVIHTIDDDGDIDYCYYPDIISMQSGNFLYTSEKNLNLGVYGTHKTGTETTKVIDSEGRDLDALGVAVGQTVRNLRDGSSAEITSISTTDSSNDTLNFSGAWSGSNSITAGDEWAVFIDAWADFTSDPYPHFPGQEAEYKWSRQILDVDGDYYVGNGNYIGKLSNDESTWDDDYCQLLPFMQFRCFDQNTGQVLIGANRQNKGVLLLWNTSEQNHYDNIIYLNNEVRSIRAYGAGWLVFAGSTLFYTNGYSIQVLTYLPDTDGITDTAMSPYGMLVINDKVFLNVQLNYYNRRKGGIYAYNIKEDTLTYHPFTDSNESVHLVGEASGGVFLEASQTQVLATYSVTQAAGVKNTLSIVNQEAGTNGMLVTYLNPERKGLINEVELSLGVNMREINAYTLDGKITVGIADSAHPFWKFHQANATSTEYDEIQVNGTTSNREASVGDMIRVLNSNASGEIAFITTITNPGEATETWTLDRNLSAYIQDSQIVQVMPVKKLGEITLNSTSLSNPYHFTLGKKFDGPFLLVVFIKMTTGDIEIRNINVY